MTINSIEDFMTKISRHLKIIIFLCLDGRHKLIRWRFVTHAGIDGYSKLIVYLRCSTNNCATTVLQEYKCGTEMLFQNGL